MKINFKRGLLLLLLSHCTAHTALQTRATVPTVSVTVNSTPINTVRTLEQMEKLTANETEELEKITTTITNLTYELQNIIFWAQFRFPWYFKQNYINTRIAQMEEQYRALEQTIINLPEGTLLQRTVKNSLLDSLEPLRVKFTASHTLFNPDRDPFALQSAFEESSKVAYKWKDLINKILYVSTSIQTSYNNIAFWCAIKWFAVPWLVTWCTKKNTRFEAQKLYLEIEAAINGIPDETLQRILKKTVDEQLEASKKYYE